MSVGAGLQAGPQSPANLRAGSENGAVAGGALGLPLEGELPVDTEEDSAVGPAAVPADAEAARVSSGAEAPAPVGVRERERLPSEPGFWISPATPPIERRPRRWQFSPGPLAATLAAGILIGLGLGYRLGRDAPGAPLPQSTTGGAVTVGGPATREAGGRRSPNPPAEQGGPAPTSAATRVSGPDVIVAPMPLVGRLQIRSNPPGARVSINGRSRGSTPLDLQSLPLGSYQVRVDLPGYAPETRSLEVSDTRPIRVSTFDLTPATGGRQGRTTAAAQPSRQAVATSGVGRTDRAPGSAAGSLLVESRPAGARVLVDGRPAGLTPLTLASLPAGTHEVRIEREGYRPWTSRVQVAAGRRARVAASLESAGPAKD
jgi:hypothetical protein